MLHQHFAMRKEPFGNTPDPQFLFTQGLHGEVLSSMHRGFENNARLQTLIAPAGMGKTTILFSLMEFVQQRARVVFLCNTLLTGPDLLGALASEFGIPEPSLMDTAALRSAIDKALKLHASTPGVIIILDEAQDLDSSAIAEIGGILQRAPASLQLVLAGQADLHQNLRHPAMMPWRNVKPHALVPLSREDVRSYVQHHLDVAGNANAFVFTPDALDYVCERSGGIPRVINQICSDALVKAFTLSRTVIDSQLFEYPIDYTVLALHLENVIETEPLAAAQPLPPAAAVSSESAAPNGAAASQPRSDTIAFAIHGWLQQRSPIWTGTASELLSRLREIDNSGLQNLSPKELSRELEANIELLQVLDIKAEIRQNPNGPRMISLRLQPASERVLPVSEARPRVAQKMTG